MKRRMRAHLVDDASALVLLVTDLHLGEARVERLGLVDPLLLLSIEFEAHGKDLPSAICGISEDVSELIPSEDPRASNHSPIFPRSSSNLAHLTNILGSG